MVTTEPTTARSLKDPANERVAWKRRMAEMRRTNLREGIVELKKRQLDQKYRLKKRSEILGKQRTFQRTRPQREDERLTNPTITAAMSKMQVGAVPDPDREQRVAEKKARVAQMEAAKEEARKDALHTLYMHAREFITTEEQLNQKIEEIFQPKMEGQENVWDAWGAPDTLQQQLSSETKTQKGALEFHEKPGRIVKNRMKVIAEEMTGGKMD
jgi:hypothetical protein